MAGIRFQTTVYSYNSWSYFIQIWDRNYTGSTITEITLGQGGPQINWDSDNDDRFSTIMSSSCEIPLMVEGTLLENWLKSVRDSYEEKDVYVHIYRNTQATASSLIWSGFLLMDLNSTVDEFFPYEFRLTFTDGLSLLKEVDFVETGATKPYDSSEMLWGPASYSFWMKTVLGKVGAALTTEGAITDWEWRTSINWYNTGHGTSAPSTLTFDPFAKTEVQVSMFHNEENDGVYQPQNCYDVLNELLKHWGARIVYWRHKFWIIQIPEYNTAETGTLANPDNINTRKYFHSSNSVSDAFDNLNDYWTPYQVFLQASGVIGPSKIVGTKYDFKAPIKEVIAKYITGSGENYFGGFPTSENTVVTQERINNLADASGIYLDIPLIFTQDRSSVNSGLTGGQFESFSADIRYQLAATNLAHGGSTTKFLHYNYSTNTYSWNTSAPSSVNNRPRWYASNLNFTSGSSGLITQQLGGPDNGAAILIPTDSSFTGLFDITIQIFNFVNGVASSKYAFIDNDTGANWADPRDIGLTWENVASVSGTTLSSSSYMAGPIRIRTYFQPNGNPFAGQLLALGANLQVSATAQNIIQDSNNDNNSSIRNFDELLWGDSPASVSRGAIEVIDTSGTRTTTVTSGQWGVGVINGTQTFSKLLLDRFLEGQLTSIRVANFRLVIPTEAKEKDDGTAVRPQYINPVGLLVENRPQEAPMSYVMQRGTFHVLMDEWDFQGFEIQSESTSASTVTVTDSRGGAIDIPVNTAPPSFLQRPPSSSINSAARNNIITTLTTAISGLGSDLVANGNYDELSSELVTNGDFSTDSDWTKGTGWSIANGVASCDGSQTTNSNLSQSSALLDASGKTYKITFTIINYVSGGVEVYPTNTTVGTYPKKTANGTFTRYVNVSSATPNDILYIQANSSFIGSVDNVSVKQVDPDDDWTKGTGWSIQDDQAQYSGSADAALEQAGVFTEGTKYKVSIDVAEISGGELEVKDQTTIHQTITSAGGYEFTFTAANTALQLNANTGSVERTIKINSITAQEVSSTTSLAINSIGEAIFATGDKFSLLNINNNTTYDLTINANQSASDTTLTITSFDFEAIVPVGSIVTFNKKNLIKQYQDDTLQEVTDNGNTTTNSISIGSSSAPQRTLHVGDSSSGGRNIRIEGNQSSGSSFSSGIEFSNTGRSGNQIDFKIGLLKTDNFVFKGTGGVSEIMRIEGDNERVGIGTTSPSAKLEVSASGTTSQEIAHFGNSNGVGKIKLQLDGFGSSKLTMLDSDNNEDIVLNTQGDSYFNISHGNVGIGTTSPLGKLHIQNSSVRTSVNSGADNLIIEEDAYSGITILSNNNNAGQIHFGDQNSENVGMIQYFHSDNSFRLFTNSSEKFRINSSGNVLIGTTFDFGHKLQVQSNTNPQLFLTGDSGAGIAFIDTDTSQEDYQIIVGANDMVFRRVSDSSDRIRIYGSSGNISLAPNSGNVGISNSNPSRLLTIGDGTGSPNIQLLSADAGNARIEFGDNSDSDAGEIQYVHSDNYMQFTTNGSERLRIKSDGKVGIGTTSPSAILHAYATTGIISESPSNATITIRRNDNVQYGAFLKYHSGNSEKWVAGLSDAGDFTDSTGNEYFIGTSKTNPIFLIDSSGNVGIGTTSPQSKADINGTLRVIGQVTPSGGAGLEIGYSGAGKLRAIDRATTTYKLLDFIASKFTFKIDGTEKMRLSDDGRLGISTSTPETELDVNGTCTSQLLQLRRQDSTPSEPETDKSIIFMDSSGDIKVLINVGGTTVTRTLATYA